MSVEVVVPWAGACEHRLRAREWTLAHHRHPVTLAPGGEPWCKAEAVMPAIEASDADVIVVADADCWAPHLDAAIEAVADGAPWAIPHRGVFRLDEQGTAAVLSGEQWERQPLEDRAYLGIEGGGIVVLSRTVALDCPFDRRFVGWGQEDECWGAALRCLYGAPKRIRGPLVHLWHPPQQRLDRRVGSLDGWMLRRRYFAAADRPDAMRNLIEEGRHVRDAHQHPVHADPPPHERAA